MRFIVDECVGPKVANWLKNQNHTVFSVYEDARGEQDLNLLLKAQNEGYVVITSDKDFGELVFHQGLGHNGIILLRLQKGSFDNKIYVLRQILEKHMESIENNFIVATENTIRITKNKEI